MVNRIIDASLNNRFIVLLLHAPAGRRGHLVGAPAADRRGAGRDQRAGPGAHAGAGARADRGRAVRHLPGRGRHERPAAGRGDPLGHAVRPLGGDDHLRGGDRHLLGPATSSTPGSSRPGERSPAGYGEPEMGPISTGLGEIYQFEVKAEPGYDYDLMELRSILDWQIAFQLRSVPGVVEVNTFGGELKTYEVQVDPEKLLNYKIPLEPRLRGAAEEQPEPGRRLPRPLQRAADRPRRGADRQPRRRRQTSSWPPARTARRSTSATSARSASPPCSARGPSPATASGEAVVGIVMMLIGENGRVVVDRVKERLATRSRARCRRASPSTSSTTGPS